MTVTDAQEELRKAHNYFKKQKAIFSDKETFLNKTKSQVETALEVVEKAKASYQHAVQKLKEAQIVVDNLCKIRKCNSLCIPGLRCKFCSKKRWIIRIYYPCCHWSRCLFQIKDPVCIAKNIACKVIRSFAFAVLEGAKIAVKASMIKFDIAEIALNTAVFIADKAHWAFEIAARIFDVAKLMLEAAELLLESTKKAFDAVKAILSTAAKVFNMILEHGLKNIVDVRDCTFQFQIIDRDLPIFDVKCYINLFKLGWRPYKFPINFLHPSVSIYHAAKAVVNNGMRTLELFGRKKRNAFVMRSKIYTKLRQLRDTYYDIVNVNETFGFESNPTTDYEYRTAVYAKKCTEIRIIEEFMRMAFLHLYTIANDSNNIYNVREEFDDEISTMKMVNITEDLSFENLDVSREYAREDYNLTDDEINSAEEQSRNEIMNTSVLNDFKEIVNMSRNNTDAELNNIDSINFLSYWLASMDNATEQYFDPNVCSGFQDCLLYCLSVLFSLFAEEELPNIEMIQDLITHLDENVTILFLSQNVTMKELLLTMEYLNSTITNIFHLNPFCSTAPSLRSDLQNITATIGSKVMFSCDAVGDPQPDIWWFKDDEIIPGEQMAYLVISNIGPEDEAEYHCIVGNVVANLSSNEAWLHVIEQEISDPDTADDEILEPYIIGLVTTICILVVVVSGIASVVFIVKRKKQPYRDGHEEGEIEFTVTARRADNRPVHFNRY